MKKIFLLIIFAACFQSAYALDYAKDGFPPLQPVYQSNQNFSRISQAEKTILGQTYENQNIAVRLDRLERTVFNRTFPKMSYEQRMNNIIVNYKNTLKNNSAFNNLSKLERKIFKNVYDGDLDEDRIARLEERIMGTIQSGDLNTRYHRLMQAIPDRSYTTFAPYSGVPIMSGGGWRGLAGSLGNFFSGAYGGYPTGWSPQITSPFINDYGPDFQRGFYTNRGWNYHNTNYGSGSGVRILH